MKIYLDNAASTAVDPKVLEIMMPWLTDGYGNPSSIHSKGRETRAAVEKARKTVAGRLNASTAEIFFTSGGTESNNFVLQNAVNHLGIKHIISSKIEHHCVLHTLELLAENQEISIHFVDILRDGHIDMASLKEILAGLEEPAMVSLMYVNNELGNILDVKSVGELCTQYGALFHTDSVQAITHQEIDLQELKIDFLSGSAHKFHGPKGIGFLYSKADHQVKPLIIGGSQERNMRAGTENVASIVGLAEAMELGYAHLEEDRIYIQGLKDYFIDNVKERLPEATFVGDISEKSQYTILNISFENYSNSSLLLLNLDIEGVCVSGGSACSSGADAGSHVLASVYPDKSIKESIRFSFSKTNTRKELDLVLDYLTDQLESKRAENILSIKA